MHHRARPMLTTILLVCIAVISALLLAGCANGPAADAAQVSPGLPFVTHLEDIGGRVMLAESDGRVFILAEQDVTLEVGADGLRPVTDVDVPGETPAGEYPSMPSFPVECQDGLTMLHTENEFGSPVKMTFADGSELLLEPRAPIRAIRDAGLADIDGDGVDELLLIALGDPAVCNDTYTGYVGWAELGDDGLYDDVEWQEPLGGGLVGLAIADIDGQAGQEVILGVYETYCTGTPSDLWVFSP